MSKSILEKYCPKNINDVIGNKLSIKKIKNWLTDYENKKKDIKRAILITGCSGTGKTLISTLSMKEYGYNIFEFNASDIRSHKSIRDKIDKLILQKDVTIITNQKPKKNGIIMDEIDGMGVGDKGGLAELIKIINPLRGKRSIKKHERDYIENRWIPPIICISNNIYDKKINELKKDCLEVKIEKCKYPEISIYIKNIIQNEDIKMNDECIRFLIGICDSDIRRMLVILDDIKGFYKNKCIEKKDLIKIKNNFLKENIDIGLYEATNRILIKDIGFKKGLNLFDTERCLLPLMIHENFINSIESRNSIFDDKLQTTIAISELLSSADMIDKYIYTNQCWDLQDLQGICSCIIPSYLINNLGDTDSYVPINFTVSLGKTSLQYTNNKTVENVIQTTTQPDFKIDNMIVLYKKCINYLNSSDIKKQKLGKELLLHYNLNIEDIDRLVKMNKQNNSLEYVLNKSKSKLKDL